MAKEKLSAQVTALMQQLEKMNKGFSDATEKLKKFDENIAENNRKYQQKSSEIRSALGRTDDDDTIAKLAERQAKFIRNLNNALIRIENKTYGICRQTGKLISKERLRLVPHATLSIEAKKSQ